MDIGIVTHFDGTAGKTLKDCADAARAIEAAGFNSMWHGDHVVTFETYAPNYPYSPDGQPAFSNRQAFYDPLIAVAASAAATSTLRVGTSVVILPQRNPVVLAQQVVALDHLSAGRVTLGVGIGWSAEEYAACGAPWEQRGACMDEYLDAMQALWYDDLSTFDGEFVSFRDVVAMPKPIQPRIPILIGGGSLPAWRRTARRGDGLLTCGLAPEEVKPHIARLNEVCAAEGRDPESLANVILIFHADDADLLKANLDAAHEVKAAELIIVPTAPHRTLDETLTEISEIAASRPSATDKPSTTR